MKKIKQFSLAETGFTAVLKHITLNLIRLDLTPRKGGIKARRPSPALPMLTAPSYLTWLDISCDALAPLAMKPCIPLF